MSMKVIASFLFCLFVLILKHCAKCWLPVARSTAAASFAMSDRERYFRRRRQKCAITSDNARGRRNWRECVKIPDAFYPNFFWGILFWPLKGSFLVGFLLHLGAAASPLFPSVHSRTCLVFYNLSFCF